MLFGPDVAALLDTIMCGDDDVSYGSGQATSSCPCCRTSTTRIHIPIKGESAVMSRQPAKPTHCAAPGRVDNQINVQSPMTSPHQVYTRECDHQLEVYLATSLIRAPLSYSRMNHSAVSVMAARAHQLMCLPS